MLVAKKFMKKFYLDCLTFTLFHLILLGFNPFLLHATFSVQSFPYPSSFLSMRE